MTLVLRALAISSAFSLLYAADVPRSYRVETVAGSSRIGDGGPAAAAQIGYIQGIALDRFGNLYIAETDRHRVRKVDGSGVITTVAGTGVAGFGGDGGPAGAALLNLPYGLAADAAGNLFIADLGNNRVRRVSPGGAITTVAGTGTAASSGDGGAAEHAAVFAPRNLAVDASGALYVSEFQGHSVRKIARDGRIGTVAGTGIAGFGGDGGPAARAQLDAPAGLALDLEGNLYIADSANQRVRRVAPTGVISTFAEVSAAHISPLAVAVDSHGTCYLTDGFFAVWQVTPPSDVLVFAGTGPGFLGDGGPADEAMLNAARDLAVDAAGNIYIADSTGTERELSPLGRIRVVDAHGIIRTVAGDGYLHPIGDAGLAIAAGLYLPSAIALDRTGNLYIADTGTQRIRQIGTDGNIRTLAGNGIPARGTDQMAGPATSLYSPRGVWAEPAGTVLIADTYGHRIRRVGLDGRVATVIGTGIAGLGAENMPWDQAQLSGPRGICADGAGVIFVVDTLNNRVLRAAPGTLIAIAAGNGTRGYAGDGGPARGALLNQPAACAVDPAGNLFIADTGNHRVRKVTSGWIGTVAGTGTAGSTGDEGPAAAALLDAPAGLAVSSNGDLFIADTGSNRIRQVTSDGVIHALGGLGAPGFGGDGGPALDAQFRAPSGLFLDGAGDLYVADTGNDRVRRMVPLPEAPPPIATAPVSVANAASLRPGPVAPGEVVAIFGTDLGPETGVEGVPDASGRIATALAGVEVLFDGVAAPLLYAREDQINAQAPYTLAGDTARLEIRYGGVPVAARDVAVAAVSPGVFPAVLNQDGTVNSEASPAPRNTVITLYATGEGLTDGANIAGAPATAPYAVPAKAVGLAIGGMPARIVWNGSAPGMVGVLQVSARVPGAFLASGPQKLELSVGDVPAPPLTIWVQ
jgi:uncharacterized protein (TIGR03437 family)